MLILLVLLLFYGLRFVGRTLWRAPCATLHVVLAWCFMAMGAFHGLGMIYDPARAYRHSGMLILCYAWSICECIIVASLPTDARLPKAQVVP
jgi:hypothetical protein